MMQSDKQQLQAALHAEDPKARQRAQQLPTVHVIAPVTQHAAAAQR
jgi:hypothetical protein